MNVIFLGFGKVGFHCLQDLVSHGVNVRGVVPRSSDHANKNEFYSVRTLAAELNIPTYHHGISKDYDKHISLEDIDYIISVQYDRILNDEWLSIPKRDTLNLHFSFLPKLRGCFPTKWAIIEENFSGVTLHSVDAGIDTGPILAQRKVFFNKKETDKTLYLKLSQSAVELFKENIPFIKSGSFPHRVEQINSKSSYHPKELPFEGVLDLSKGIDFCDRFLRAFDFKPFPPAVCRLEKFNLNDLGLYSPIDAKKTNMSQLGLSNITNDGLLEVHSSDGILYFDKVFIQNSTISISEFEKFIQ